MGAFVIFQLGGAFFALKREAVARILPAPRLTAPPAGAPAIAGFFAFGPEIVATLHAEALLGRGAPREPRLYDHIILLKLDPSIGLLVDRASDVLDADDCAGRAVPEGATHRGSVIAEIETRLGGALLLDPSRLLGAYETDRVRAFHEEERRRRLLFGDAA